MNKSIGNNIVKHQIRYDLEIIARLIKPNSKILDIGCGSGELLEFLKKQKSHIVGRGLEMSHILVNKALNKGLQVTRGNAETDLTSYPDRSFDYAILSQTLQETQNPKQILQEMMRIAEFGIVSFPNFAHYRNRWQLMFNGSMPVSKTIPFEWYETPNIHFCSIKDFKKLCHQSGFKIKEKFFLTSKHHTVSKFCGDITANFFAEFAIFLLEKSEYAPTAQEEFTFGKDLRKSLDIALKAPSGANCLSKKPLSKSCS